MFRGVLSGISPDKVMLIGMFVIAFFIQYCAWISHNDVTDQYIWSKAVVLASHDMLYQPDVGPEIVNSAYGYPGTTIILPSAFLVRIGVSPLRALQLVLMFSIAMGIAATVWISYRLRPLSMWWLTTAIILLCSDLYYIATPASSVMTVWVPFMLLSVIYIAENLQEDTTKITLLLGVVSGYAIATRFDISIALSMSILIFLMYLQRKIPWVYIAACAVSLLVCDPFLWSGPIQHLAICIYKSLVVQNIGAAPHQAWSARLANAPVILESAPPAILSFVGAIILLRFRGMMPFSLRNMIWVLVTTLIISVALFSLYFHPQWYFFPLYMFWEVVLPLSIWTFFDAQTRLASYARTRYANLLIGGVLASQVYLFLMIILAYR